MDSRRPGSNGAGVTGARPRKAVERAASVGATGQGPTRASVQPATCRDLAGHSTRPDQNEPRRLLQGWIEFRASKPSLNVDRPDQDFSEAM
jgi:hypothetical protein